jgi:hypothetical protein
VHTVCLHSVYTVCVHSVYSVCTQSTRVEVRLLTMLANGSRCERGNAVDVRVTTAYGSADPPICRVHV